jgi:hypothetical protein
MGAADSRGCEEWAFRRLTVCLGWVVCQKEGERSLLAKRGCEMTGTPMSRGTRAQALMIISACDR